LPRWVVQRTCLVIHLVSGSGRRGKTEARGRVYELRKVNIRVRARCALQLFLRCRRGRSPLVRRAERHQNVECWSTLTLRRAAGGDTLGATLEVRPLALCAPAPSTQRRCVAIARPNLILALTAWFLHVSSSASLHSAQNRKIHGPCHLACAPTRARLLSLWCAPASPARGVAVSHPRPNV
jgi:hypothetical protein